MTAAPSRPVASEPSVEPVSDSQLPPTDVLHTPSHWRLPLIGVLLDPVLGNTGPALARKHGPVYRSRHFVGACVVVTKHATVCALQKNPRLLSSRHSMVALEDIFGANSLVYLDGIEHAKSRAVYAPLFTPHAIGRVFSVAHDSALEMLAELSRATGRTARPVNIEPACTRHFFRVALALLMKDASVAAMVDDAAGDTRARADGTHTVSIPIAAFSKDLNTILRNLYLPKVPPLTRETHLAMHRLFAIAQPLLYDRLETDAHIIDLLRSGSDSQLAAKTALLSQQMDFMTVLAAQSALPTGRGVRERGAPSASDAVDAAKPVVSVFAAGYLTTAPTFLSCLSHVFGNPALVAALEDEQRAVEHLTLQTVNDRMPLLTSVLYETLRVSPVGSVASRVATQDVYIERHCVRKGERVVMDVWAANRDADVFDRPDVFDAYRFVPRQDGNQPSVSSVLTFGAPGNPHFCMGAMLAKMEIKVTIALLLRNYDVRLTRDSFDDFVAYPVFKPRKVEFVQCSPKTHPL